MLSRVRSWGPFPSSRTVFELKLECARQTACKAAKILVVTRKVTYSIADGGCGSMQRFIQTSLPVTFSVLLPTMTVVYIC